MNSWHHAQSSARKWGGSPDLYLPVHEFIDSSKRIIGDVRHRSLYHHTEGVWLAQRIFGVTLDVPKQRSTVQVPVRLIAEQHVLVLALDAGLADVAEAGVARGIEPLAAKTGRPLKPSSR